MHDLFGARVWDKTRTLVDTVLSPVSSGMAEEQGQGFRGEMSRGLCL